LKLYRYDGKPSKEIKEIITCTLDVQGRRVVDTPIVVVDIHYDVILRRE
jgi:hypothetical protein